MMRSKFFGAAAVLVIGLTSAYAQTSTTTSSRRCVGNTCTTVTDTGDTKSTQTCQHGSNGATDCTIETKEKPPALPSVQTVTYDRAHEQAKAAERARSGYRDPNARVLGCDAGYRMTERDGCQPRR